MIFGVETIFELNVLSFLIVVTFSLLGHGVGELFSLRLFRKVHHSDPKTMLRAKHFITDGFGAIFLAFACMIVLTSVGKELSEWLFMVYVGTATVGFFRFLWCKYCALSIRGIPGWVVKE